MLNEIRELLKEVYKDWTPLEHAIVWPAAIVLGYNWDLIEAEFRSEAVTIQGYIETIIGWIQ